jgi:phage-related minor tail protein
MNDGNHTTQDILKKMMKNPKKMMDLVKKVGDKLKHKMDSGDISKDEIMKEAADLMNKMKEMGGTSEFQNMFKEFAAGMGKGARIDTNALNRMSKMEAMKNRMREKVGKKKENFVLEPTAIPNYYVYREEGGEAQERSSAFQKAKEDELIAMFEKTDISTSKPNISGGGGKKKGKNGKKGKK